MHVNAHFFLILMAGIYVTYMYFKGIVEVYKNIHAHVNATIQMVCCPTEVGV